MIGNVAADIARKDATRYDADGLPKADTDRQGPFRSGSVRPEGSADEIRRDVVRTGPQRHGRASHGDADTTGLRQIRIGVAREISSGGIGQPRIGIVRSGTTRRDEVAQIGLGGGSHGIVGHGRIRQMRLGIVRSGTLGGIRLGRADRHWKGLLRHGAVRSRETDATWKETRVETLFGGVTQTRMGLVDRGAASLGSATTRQQHETQRTAATAGTGGPRGVRSGRNGAWMADRDRLSRLDVIGISHGRPGGVWNDQEQTSQESSVEIRQLSLATAGIRWASIDEATWDQADQTWHGADRLIWFGVETPRTADGIRHGTDASRTSSTGQSWHGAADVVRHEAEALGQATRGGLRQTSHGETRMSGEVRLGRVTQPWIGETRMGVATLLQATQKRRDQDRLRMDACSPVRCGCSGTADKDGCVSRGEDEFGGEGSGSDPADRDRCGRDGSGATRHGMVRCDEADRVASSTLGCCGNASPGGAWQSKRCERDRSGHTDKARRGLARQDVHWWGQARKGSADTDWLRVARTGGSGIECETRQTRMGLEGSVKIWRNSARLGSADKTRTGWDGQGLEREARRGMDPAEATRTVEVRRGQMR